MVQGQDVTASSEPSKGSSMSPPQESRWARWRRKGHPLGMAYPMWIAAGLIVLLLLFAELVGWLIRNHYLGF